MVASFSVEWRSLIVKQWFLSVVALVAEILLHDFRRYGIVSQAPPQIRLAPLHDEEGNLAQLGVGRGEVEILYGIQGDFIMPKKQAEDFAYLSNNPDYIPDPDIESFMEEEISRAPKDPELLAHRLRNNTAASPRDAGGDLDAVWEDVNDSGSETVAGDNPTPDQSIVEENASAVGVSFEDNEELDFLEKIQRRDRERFELDQRSKASDDMI